MSQGNNDCHLTSSILDLHVLDFNEQIDIDKHTILQDSQ